MEGDANQEETLVTPQKRVMRTRAGTRAGIQKGILAQDRGRESKAKSRESGIFAPALTLTTCLVSALGTRREASNLSQETAMNTAC